MSVPTSSSSSAPATVADLQAYIQTLQAANTDLNTRGAAVVKALEESQLKLAAASARPPPVQHPKIPTPTKFDGRVGASIIAWIDEIEQQFDFFAAHFSDEELKIGFALSYVHTDVRKWYKDAAGKATAAGATIDTWVKLVAAMRARYQPIESEHSARASFDIAVQTSSVQAYSTHVQSIMTYITNMSDADQVHNYLRGLKQPIKLEVSKQKPTTLTEAINLAVGLEAYSKSSHAGSSSSSSASSSYRPHQSRSSYQSASSAPMDVNNIESQDESSSPYLDASSTREAHLLAVIQQQEVNQASMQQKLNALFKKNSDRRSNHSLSSSSGADRVPGITSEIYRRCRDEGVCLRCKEKDHNASSCTKPVRLNW